MRTYQLTVRDPGTLLPTILRAEITETQLGQIRAIIREEFDPNRKLIELEFILDHSRGAHGSTPVHECPTCHDKIWGCKHP